MIVEAALRQQAELYLGTDITSGEWDEAKASAEQKLRHIIEHFGDGGGQRREPWYMAQIIAEAVKSDRLRRITADLADSYEIMGTKKDSPCPKTQGRPSTTPIVA